MSPGDLLHPLEFFLIAHYICTQKKPQLSKIAKDKTILQSEQEIKIEAKHTEQSFSLDTSRAG
jgi:hypothetical protein